MTAANASTTSQTWKAKKIPTWKYVCPRMGIPKAARTNGAKQEGHEESKREHIRYCIEASNAQPMCYCIAKAISSCASPARSPWQYNNTCAGRHLHVLLYCQGDLTHVPGVTCRTGRSWRLDQNSRTDFKRLLGAPGKDLGRYCRAQGGGEGGRGRG